MPPPLRHARSGWCSPRRPRRRRWRRSPRRCQCPEPLAALLVQRGFGEPEAARAVPPPSARRARRSAARWAGMDAAVARHRGGACAPATPILVHGDYDVDGQCATALLTRALRPPGPPSMPFVPHRMRDGYDFGPAGLAAGPGGRRRADPHLRLRHHRGGDGAGGARGRHRGRRHRPPPAGRRAAARHRRRRPAARRRRTRPTRSCAAPASPSSWCRRWCPSLGLPAKLPLAPARLRGAGHRGGRRAARAARTASWCGTGSSCSRRAAGPGSAR